MMCLAVTATVVCSECRPLELQEAPGKFALHPLCTSSQWILTGFFVPGVGISLSPDHG